MADCVVAITAKLPDDKVEELVRLGAIEDLPPADAPDWAYAKNLYLKYEGGSIDAFKDFLRKSSKKTGRTVVDSVFPVLHLDSDWNAVHLQGIIQEEVHCLLRSVAPVSTKDLQAGAPLTLKTSSADEGFPSWPFASQLGVYKVLQELENPSAALGLTEVQKLPSGSKICSLHIHYAGWRVVVEIQKQSESTGNGQLGGDQGGQVNATKGGAKGRLQKATKGSKSVLRRGEEANVRPAKRSRTTRASSRHPA